MNLEIELVDLVCSYLSVSCSLCLPTDDWIIDTSTTHFFTAWTNTVYHSTHFTLAANRKLLQALNQKAH